VGSFQTVPRSGLERRSTGQPVPRSELERRTSGSQPATRTYQPMAPVTPSDPVKIRQDSTSAPRSDLRGRETSRPAPSQQSNLGTRDVGIEIPRAYSHKGQSALQNHIRW